MSAARRWACVAVVFVLASCARPGPPDPPVVTPAPPAVIAPPVAIPASGDDPPAAPREFRAAWVATVANIDWPSRRDLTSEQQRAEMIVILDRARAMNLNVIILQVRPSMDALYPSALEPWSEYLTGEQGRAPNPPWDPLQSWIDEAQKRGIEIHAWFNPYRARHNKAHSREAPNHISRTRPALVKTYGDYQWLDPGEPGSAQHTLDVILDVLKRYDIDGVHLDDYFYPYPIKQPGSEQELDFPDEPSWRAYQARGGKLARADWRRQNVNDLMQRIYDTVHREKSWVRFGISPFGIGRPDRRPPGIAGFSQYDKLYADVEHWMRRCWFDYMVPQLYWPIAQAPQAFPVLLDYWIAENTCGRHVVAGLYTSRIDSSAKSWAPAEIVNQVDESRRRPGNVGQVHFSMVALNQNRAGIADAMAQRYAMPALIPASTWIDTTAPAPPDVAVRASDTQVEVDIAARAGKPAARWAVWSRAGGAWRFAVFPARDPRVRLSAPAGSRIDRVVVTAVDRLGNESRRVALDVPDAGIVPVAAWGGTPPDASKARKHTITRITLHHGGVTYTPGRDPREYLRSLQKWSRETKGWIDIPYHYVIDLEGRAYEARPITLAGDTNTNYDTTGHALIQVVGNYDEIEPNAAQLQGVARLMTTLATRYGLSEGAIFSHRDVAADTSCPGANLYRYIENGWFRQRVRENLAAARAGS